jgi:uncharacterized protein (DUF2267 family)
MNHDRFTAIVRQYAETPDDATAGAATRAVFETLSERLMAGLIKTIRAYLPGEIAKDLSLTRPHRSVGADEFLRRVATRAGTDANTAERYTGAVFVALSRALEPEFFRALLGELSTDYGPLTAPARRPVDHLAEFRRRVADRTGLDEERALVITEAVLETLAERVDGGEVDGLINELPPELRPALERGRQHAAGLDRTMSLGEFLTLVADRAGVTLDQARAYAGAVLATLHDAVTEKQFRDLVAELPRSYVRLSHA